MSNFTKEELTEIKRCLRHMIQTGVFPYSCTTLDIKKKIQSMIDNYCEHDPYGDFHVCVDKCRKCGRIIND